MGIRLIVEMLDHAPDNLTWRERHALSVLAENANDATRECWPGIEDDPVIAHRMRLPGRSSRYEVMKALREKKAIETVSAGHRGHRAVYRIPALGPAKGPETPDAIDAEGSGNPGHSVQEPRTQSDTKGPENPDPMSEKGSGNDPERVREPHGKGPETPDPYPSDPSTPSKTYMSSARRGQAPAADDAPERDYHWPKFGGFWVNYPRKKSMGKAKTSWQAALDRGADPDQIVEAAAAYAHERHGKDPNYTPYPATWLDSEGYLDEPDPEPTPQQNNGPQTAPDDLSGLTDEEIQRALQF